MVATIEAKNWEEKWGEWNIGPNWVNLIVWW